MAARSYDLVILGGGPGGYRAAEFAAHAGMKACVVEKERLGGVCLNIGCIPTKALLKSAKVARELHSALDYGLWVDQRTIKVQWDKMQERKNAVVDKLVGGVSTLMKANKVEVVKGEGKVTSPTTVEVNGETIEFKNLLVATGSVPSVLPIPGFAEAFAQGKMIDSTAILALPKMPESLTVIGGGVIGVEFAILFAELGVDVTIVQGLDTILERLDREVSLETSRILKERGVNIVTNAKITSFDVKKGALVYELEGKEVRLKSEQTLLSVGRRPVTAGVENVGVLLDKRGSIVVDKYQRTNVPTIWAAGDCCSPIMLAHVAYKHAQIAVSNMQGGKLSVNYDNTPSCIYSHPEVATVGKTEEELKAANVPYVKSKVSARIIGKALADGEEQLGFVKLLVSPKYGEILGCHIIASTASDLIAEVVTLMEMEATVHELAASIHPHPTISEMIGDAAIDAVYKLSALKNRPAV